jgi:hypothetical protein
MQLGLIQQDRFEMTKVLQETLQILVRVKE